MKAIHVVVVSIAVHSRSCSDTVLPLCTVCRHLRRGVVDKQTVPDDNGKPGCFRFFVGRTRHGTPCFHGFVAPEFLPRQCHSGVPANKQRPAFRSHVLDPLYCILQVAVVDVLVLQVIVVVHVHAISDSTQSTCKVLPGSIAHE